MWKGFTIKTEKQFRLYSTNLKQAKLVWEWCHSLEAFSLSADFPVWIRDFLFILLINEI